MYTRKASSMGNIIIWFGVLACVGLIIVYGIPKIKPQQVELDLLHQDINTLQLIFNKACITDSLEIDFNPILREGNISINDSNLCINSSSFSVCRPYQCSFDLDEEVYNISDFTLLEIEKREDSIEVRVI